MLPFKRTTSERRARSATGLRLLPVPHTTALLGSVRFSDTPSFLSPYTGAVMNAHSSGLRTLAPPPTLSNMIERSPTSKLAKIVLRSSSAVFGQVRIAGSAPCTIVAAILLSDVLPVDGSGAVYQNAGAHGVAIRAASVRMC